jgi:hypothetical protein
MGGVRFAHLVLAYISRSIPSRSTIPTSAIALSEGQLSMKLPHCLKCRRPSPWDGADSRSMRGGTDTATGREDRVVTDRQRRHGSRNCSSLYDYRWTTSRWAQTRPAVPTFFWSTLRPISAFDHGTSRSSEFIRSHVFRFTWPSRSHRRLRRTVRAKRARAAEMSPAARALRSDVVRRAASRGGTLRCAEARRVAYRDVDKSYASHRLSQDGWSRGDFKTAPLT